MAKKVKIRRERVKKGILTEIEVPGVVFDGMESDDIPVFYVKQISKAYADTVQEKMKDIKPENFLDLVNEIMVETLADDEGNSVFDEVTEIPYSFTLAAWRPFLKKAFDLEFIGGQKSDTNEGNAEGVGDKEVITEEEAQNMKALLNYPTSPSYGPNGADDSSPSGDLSENPFTRTLEGDSSTVLP